MRYIGRALLCLLSGIVAFGVSGYFLRPQPNWTVLFGEEESLQFLGRPASDDGWVWLTRLSRKGAPRAAIAFDPATGRRVAAIVSPGGAAGWFHRRGNGVIACEILSNVRDTRMLGTTRVLLYDDRTGEPRLERTLDGFAQVLPDGVTARCAKGVPDGFVFRIVDLESGRTLKVLDFSKGYGELHTYEWSVSEDARLLAVVTRGSEKSPSTIEVWDVDHRRLIRTVTPPGKWDAESLTLQQLEFEVGRSRLQYMAYDNRGGPRNSRVFVVNLDRPEGEAATGREPWRPPVSPQKGMKLEGMKLERTPLPNGEELWTAFDGNDACHGFVVVRGDETTLPWRRMPFPSWRRTGVTPVGREGELAAEFIVRAELPPYADSLPATLPRYLPKAWKLDEPRERLHWHDSRRNLWREVGCSNVADRFARGGDALFTIALRDDKRAILESWSLPPRDPKWKAVGIGIAFAAVAWWLFARRKRRSRPLPQKEKGNDR